MKPASRRGAQAAHRVAVRRLSRLGCTAGLSPAQANAAVEIQAAAGSPPGPGAYTAAEIRRRAELAEALSRVDVGVVAGDSSDQRRVGTLVLAVAEPNVRDLANLLPGSRLASLLDRVTAEGPSGATGLKSLSEFSLVEVVAAVERLTSWAMAIQAQAAAVLADRQVLPPLPAGVVSSSLCAEGLAGRLVGARLRMSPRSGENLVRRGRHLVRELPSTLAALRSGSISHRQAGVIADETMRVDSHTARRIEDRAVPLAAKLSPAKLRRAIAEIIATDDPAGAEARHAEADSRRGVWTSPLPDGMAEFCGVMTAPDAAALMSAIDAAAVAMRRSDPGDGRTMDQRRADVLAGIGWNALRTGSLGDGRNAPGLAKGRGGRAVNVAVTVAMTTLLGLDDLPGELAGYGPVPASVARRLAADGTWRRLLTDPVTGAALDYGTTRYTPPPDLVELIQIRDRTCRWPGCNQPARRCQVDHTVPAASGGTTSHDDLGALCEPCHLAKTHAGWQLVQPRPGRFLWTDPVGHRYSVDPEPVGPVIRRGDQRSGTPPGDEPEPGPPPF